MFISHNQLFFSRAAPGLPFSPGLWLLVGAAVRSHHPRGLRKQPQSALVSRGCGRRASSCRAVPRSGTAPCRGAVPSGETGQRLAQKWHSPAAPSRTARSCEPGRRDEAALRQPCKHSCPRTRTRDTRRRGPQSRSAKAPRLVGPATQQAHSASHAAAGV